MKVINEYKIKDVFVSSIVAASNYYKEKFIVCGKNNSGEFKILVKFDVTKIEKLAKINNNIKKVELCLYLSELKLDEYVDSLMINIGQNLQNFNVEEVCYANAPRVHQEHCMYILKKDYRNQYINFNITNLVKNIISDDKENYGLAMIAISERGIAFFNNSRNDNGGFIKITYEQDINENNEKKEGENLFDEGYGYFINDTGNLISDDHSCFLTWDKCASGKLIHLGEGNSEIIIEEPGVYQVDYGTNLRSSINTYMSLLINGEKVPYSEVIVGSAEQFSYNHVLIEVNNKKSILKVDIKKVKMILVNDGIAASIRIIKVGKK